MNIVIKEDKNTKNKQPKVYDLGNVTTTIQDLLDNSRIIINGEQTIVLKIDSNFYLLDLKDYKNNDVYGLGSNVLESDLISLSLNINDVSAFVPGIVNNTSMQELGGVDKSINGVRIGRGTSVTETNVCLGYNALNSGGDGGDNVGIGDYSLFKITDANKNTSIGNESFKYLVDGNQNVAIGNKAGRSTIFTPDGIGPGTGSDDMTSCSTSIFIGYDTRPLDNFQNNQIVIGNEVMGKGSNTTTIGNDSTLKTYLKGILNIANAPVYLNNTTAIAAGLLVRDIYRTSTGILMIVY